jgi:hypothetical protein
MNELSPKVNEYGLPIEVEMGEPDRPGIRLLTICPDHVPQLKHAQVESTTWMGR